MSYTYEALSPGGHQSMLEEVFSKVREQVGSYKTASGSLVSFSDGADLPMPSFVCNIDAVQDLHGYDGPWVGGAGKNKLPKGVSSSRDEVNFIVNDEGAVSVTTTPSTTSLRFWGVQFTIPAGTYILSGCPSGGGQDTYYIDIRNVVGGAGIPGINADIGNGSTFTIAEELTAYVNIRIASGQTLSNKMFYPMIRLSTETDPTFAPYSNICPISGHTGVGAWVRWKNLVNWKWNTFNNDKMEIFLKGGTYTLSAESTLSDGKGYIRGTKPSGEYVSREELGLISWSPTTTSGLYYGGSAQQQTYTFNVPNGGAKIEFGKINNNGTISAQLESGSTASTYTPYNPNSQTIQVSWQTEAGEVFGGYVDLVSGILTVTHYKKQLTRNMDWSKSSSGYNAFYVSGAKISPARKEGTAAICNIAKYSSESEYTSKPWYLTRDGSLGMSTDENIIGGTTIDNWKDYISNNTVEICYELATPITYQLTPMQIKSLLGNNNAWCDTGDIKLLQYQPNNIIAELRAEILDLQARVEELEQTE